MADFRSERMPSPEGEGRAKSALESAYTTYYKANKSFNERLFGAFPELREALRGYSGARLLDLLGFWLMWRISGGFEGTQKALGISKSQMYRRIALFREAFGEHPDVYEFPGITVDPVEFLAGMSERLRPKPKS
jgi:hypothetical protein